MRDARYGSRMTDWPPTAEEVDGLPVDALGIAVLRYVERSGKTTLRGVVGRARSETAILNDRQRGITGAVVADSSMPLGQRYELSIAEAWQWLIATGLIAELPMEEHWFVVSRRGEKALAALNPTAHVQAEQRVALDLHPLIHSRVRSQFLLGEYDAAVLIAMKTVEERVRKLAGASDSDVGVDLMKRSFKPDGPLRDPMADPGEADGQMALFWGAIGFFKNPASHRRVDYDSPTEASEVVLLAICSCVSWIASSPTRRKLLTFACRNSGFRLLIPLRPTPPECVPRPERRGCAHQRIHASPRADFDNGQAPLGIEPCGHTPPKS